MQHRLVALGDVHFGAVPADRLKHELDAVLFSWLKANEFSALIQLGDLFDRRLSLDSNDSKAVMQTVVRLCQLCQERGVPLRIVQGTISHDYDQLSVLRPLETEYSCFRLITSAQHEELLPGFDVLWMPEQYPTDYADFYGQFLFDDPLDPESGLIYDAIFGHGEIDVAAGWSRSNEGERHYGGTPCHDSKMLLRHSSGPVWFGHVHTRFVHAKRLGYPGSFTRWVHGEETEKSFDVLDLKQTEAGWTVRRSAVKNTLAPVYRTVLASELWGVAMPLDEMVAAVRTAADGAHKLRVKMDDYPIGIEELSMLRGALVEDHRIDIMSMARVAVETPGSEPSEGESEDDAKPPQQYAYLRDPSLPGEERLLRYLHEKSPQHSDITVEDVRELTAPLVA